MDFYETVLQVFPVVLQASAHLPLKASARHGLRLCFLALLVHWHKYRASRQLEPSYLPRSPCSNITLHKQDQVDGVVATTRTERHRRGARHQRA